MNDTTTRTEGVSLVINLILLALTFAFWSKGIHKSDELNTLKSEAVKLNYGEYTMETNEYNVPIAGEFRWIHH